MQLGGLEQVELSKKPLRRLGVGGSKAGASYHLRKVLGANDHFPRERHYLPADATKKKRERVFEKLTKDERYVVRVCHPGDIYGLVDVLPTDLGENKDGVEGRDVPASLEALQERLQQDDIRSFTEYEFGRPIEPDEYSFFIPTYEGGEGGSVVEYPEGIYRIEYRHPSQIGGEGATEIICNEKGEMLNIQQIRTMFREALTGKGDMPSLEDIASVKVSPKEFFLPGRIKTISRNIIDLYRTVADSELYPRSHSFQMEYGTSGDTILFYQARLFRKFDRVLQYCKTAKDFRGQMVGAPFSAFGTTDPEGIEVDWEILDKEGVDDSREKTSVAYYRSAHRNRTSTALHIQPHNMAAYAPREEAVLAHEHMRWMMKAPLTVAGPVASEMAGMRDSDNQKMQFWSNGVIAGVRNVR